MKKTLSMVLALALVLFSFSGIAFADTVTLPIVEEPMTFEVAVETNGYCLIPWGEKPIYHQLAEETNVHFVWNELNDWGTQTNLLVASGDTPDLFMGGLSSSTLNENLDMFHELTDLIYTYAPSLVALYEEEPSVLAGAKSSDGGIYQLTTSFTLNLDDSIGTCYWINQDWLDAVGMTNPTTIEELEEVLIAFRDGDPNGNGLADEIPFAFQETGWAGKISNMFGIFGVLYNTGNYVQCDDEGKVYFQANQDAFYEGLVWLNSLAKQGLLDQEGFSQTGDQFSSKISQNVLGVCAKYNPQNFLDGFVPMNLIEGPNGNTVFSGTNDSGHGGSLIIPTSCENPEVLVQFYEYVNSDFDRKMSNRYGEKGVYWDDNPDGEGYILHDYDSTPPEGYEFWDQYVYTYGAPGGKGFGFFSKALLQTNASPKTARETAIISYQPYFPKVEYHAAALPEDLASEKNMLYVEIDAYVQNFVAGAIFGEIDEGIWQNHLDTLQMLEVDRYVELCQESYNTYLALIAQ